MIGNEITAVAASPVQSRVETQTTAPAPEPKLENNLPEPGTGFTTSTIRVDANLDLAILEFKSSETGDILRQYPTESQIADYQRAAQLEAQKEVREQSFANNAQSITASPNNAGTETVSADVSAAPQAAQQTTAQSVSIDTANSG